MRLYVMEVLNYKSDVEVTGFKSLKKKEILQRSSWRCISYDMSNITTILLESVIIGRKNKLKFTH